MNLPRRFRLAQPGMAYATGGFAGAAAARFDPLEGSGGTGIPRVGALPPTTPDSGSDAAQRDRREQARQRAFSYSARQAGYTINRGQPARPEAPRYTASGFDPYGAAASFGQAANQQFSALSDWYRGQADLQANEIGAATDYYTKKFNGKVPTLADPMGLYAQLKSDIQSA